MNKEYVVNALKTFPQASFGRSYRLPDHVISGSLIIDATPSQCPILSGEITSLSFLVQKSDYILQKSCNSHFKFKVFNSNQTWISSPKLIGNRNIPLLSLGTFLLIYPFISYNLKSLLDDNIVFLNTSSSIAVNSPLQHG